jgi:hypothetical protein
MTVVLMAEFESAATLDTAARALDPRVHHIRDALSPCPVETLDELIADSPSSIRKTMLLGGLITAAFAYGLQVYSSVFAYPLNSGGRPLHSWPVFLLVPIEVGILAAGLCGTISFFVACNLPRLHHPLFEVPGIERASQDRYFLVIESANDAESGLRRSLEQNGALTVSRVPQP